MIEGYLPRIRLPQPQARFPADSRGLPLRRGDCRKSWGLRGTRAFSGLPLTWGESVAWILRLVKIGTDGEGRSRDVMEIERPDDLADIADLGLTLSETKRLLATLQQEIIAAQVRDHAVRQPICSCCGGGCRVKDYQDHLVATLFGQVTIRLPRFRCAVCCGSESKAYPVDSGSCYI